MANLRQARRRIYVVLGVLLAVDIAAAIVLLTPIAGSGAVRQQEFDAVRRQLKQKMQLVIPPDQVQSRVDQARAQIDARELADQGGFGLDRHAVDLAGLQRLVAVVERDHRKLCR